MSKSITVAHIVFYILVTFFTLNLHAETGSNSSTSFNVVHAKQDCRQNWQADGYKSFKECYNSTFPSNSNLSQSCTTAYADMNKKISEFTAACTASKMGASPSTCIAKVRKCDECMGADIDNDDCAPDGDIDFSDDDDEYGNAYILESIKDQLASGGRTPELLLAQTKYSERANYDEERAQAMVDFKHCPSLAGRDLKELREEEKEAKKEYKELKKELAELEEDARKEQNETQDSIIEIQDELQKLEMEAKKALQEIQDSAEDYKKDVQKNVQEARNAIEQLASKIKEGNEQIRKAYIDHLAAIAEIENQCVEKAQANLEKLRDKKRALLQQRKFSSGGFNSAIKSSYLSSYQRSERKMKQLYTRCTKSKSHKDKQRIANESYKLTLQTLERQIKDLRTQQGQIHQSIMTMIGQMPGDLNKIQQQLVQTQQEYQQQFQKLQQQLQLMQQRGMKQTQTMQRKIAQTKGEMEDAEAYMDHKRDMLALKNKYKPNYPEGNGRKVNATAAHHDAKSAITSTLGACGCCGGNYDNRCGALMNMAKDYGANSEGCSSGAPAVAPSGSGSTTRGAGH